MVVSTLRAAGTGLRCLKTLPQVNPQTLLSARNANAGLFLSLIDFHLLNMNYRSGNIVYNNDLGAKRSTHWHCGTDSFLLAVAGDKTPRDVGE